MKWILPILLLVSVLAQDNVVVLTNETFYETIANNPFVLVKFFAPWCGHCKALAPEYEKLARIVKNEGKPFVIAELDANAYSDIGGKEQIDGFPTIKFYVNGLVFKFNGDRTAQDMLDFLDRKTSPPSTNLATEEDITAQKEATGLRCIYALSKDNNMGVYFSVAATAEDFTFYHAPHELVVKVFPDAKENSVILLKDFDEGMNIYTGEMVADKFEMFLQESSTPLVSMLSQDLLDKVFTPNGTPGVILYYNSTDESKVGLEDMLRKVASDVKSEGYLFILTDPTEPLGARVSEFLGIEPSSVPILEFVVAKNELMRYRHEGPITVESIKTFLEDWKNGKVPRYIKSEPEPTENPGPVFTVVGSNFKKLVLENTDDVIVTFYAAWCQHCKKLEPAFAQLAEAMKNNTQLKFAKIDAVKNEIEGHLIESFPTIKLFPGKNKTEAITYTGNRTAIGIATFIKENASYPIEIPEEVNNITIEEDSADIEGGGPENEGEEDIDAMLKEFKVPDEEGEEGEKDSDSDSDDEEENDEDKEKKKDKGEKSKDKKEKKKEKKEKKKEEKQRKKEEKQKKKEEKNKEKEEKKKQKDEETEKQQTEEEPKEQEVKQEETEKQETKKEETGEQDVKTEEQETKQQETEGEENKPKIEL